MPFRTSAIRAAIAAAALLALAAPVLAAAGTTERSGRFAMSPVEGGVMRLDTETGAMSLCRKAGEGWSCEALADSARAQADELARTKRELTEARATIRHLEEMLLGKDGEAKPSDKPGSGFRLPSEQEVDQAMDYVERLLKKFRDRLKQLDGADPGTPL